MLPASSVTVGATLATATDFVSVLLLASSESLTWTLTVLTVGPSRNVQSKLPAPVAAVKAGFERVPFGLQLWLTRLNVSAPGSMTLKLKDFVWPSFAVAAASEHTVGATLAIVMACGSSSDTSPSFAVTLTVVDAGPSGNVQVK